MPGDIWLTFPDGTEHELEKSVTIGRDASSDLAFESPTASREHAALTTVVHGSLHSPIVAPGSTIVSKPSRVCASHCRRDDRSEAPQLLPR